MRTTMQAVAVAAVMAACGCSQAADTGAVTNVAWLLDFSAAKQAAAAKNLPILADFSGSDWCGWCIKLDKEVFSQQAFQNYARTNLVLFLADFPRRKSQPDGVVSQNRKLAETYGVEGYPTVLILDAKGKELARTGYQPGGPDKYVQHVKDLIK